MSSDLSRVRGHLLGAIETMRNACANAARRVDQNNDDLAYAVAAVIHELSWGFANASSSIENASVAVRDALEIAILKQGEQQ